MLRVPGQRTTSTKTTSSRAKVSASNDTRQASSRSAKGASSATAGAQEAKVAFNEALASLSRVPRDKSLDVNAVAPTIENASASLEILRERAAAGDAAQAHMIAHAASALCGHCIDVKAYSQAKQELITLALSLRSQLGVDAPPDLTWPTHLAVPFNQDTSKLSPSLVLLVISTQLYILATVLRPAHSQTDWKSLGATLVTTLEQPGHPLQWRSFLADTPDSADRDAHLDRIHRKLSTVYATILKTTAGVDSSSSSAIYDPDSLLRLRLYGITCGLWSSSWAPEAKDEDVENSRESFWDEARRTFGYYMRSVTVLKFSTSITSLTDLLQPVLDVASTRHSKLCQGPKFEALKAVVASHDGGVDQLHTKMAKLSVHVKGEEVKNSQDDVLEAMEKTSRGLDRWRRSKDATSLPSMQEAATALKHLPETTPALATLKVALSKAFSHAESGKDQGAIQALYGLMDAWVACLKRLRASTKTSSEVLQHAIDLIVQMAQYDIKSSPTKADNILEEGVHLVSDKGLEHVHDFHAARVLSAASYNLGGILQRTQGRSDGLCARFFKRACLVGQAALKAFPEHKDASALGAQMANRWGVLASALQNMTDRKGSLEATGEALRAGIDKLAAVPGMISAEDLKRHDKTLATLITAQARLAAVDLFRSPQEVSLASLYNEKVPSSIVGAVFETQLAALERSAHKERVKAVMDYLIEQLLGIYTPREMPLRRARTLLYRMKQEDRAEPLSTLKRQFEELLGLTLVQDLSLDGGLAEERLSLRTQAHLLHALKIYQAPGSSANTMEACDSAAEQTEEAISCLQHLTNPLTDDKTDTDESPSTVMPSNSPGPRPKRKTIASTPAVSRTTRGKSRAASSVLQTPKVKSSSVIPQTPRVIVTPQEQAPVKPLATLRPVLDLARHVVNLLGFLGLPYLRLRMLLQLSSMTTRQDATEYRLWVVSALAQAWMAYGAIFEAETILVKQLAHKSMPSSSDALAVPVMLQKAQCLALQGECAKAFQVYSSATTGARSRDTSESADQTMQDLLDAITASHTLSVIYQSRGDVNKAISAEQHCLQGVSRSLSILSRRRKAGQTRQREGEQDFLASGEAPAPSSEVDMSKDCSKWALELYYFRFQSLARLAHLSIARGSCKIANSFAKQLLEVTTSLSSPILRAVATGLRAQLALLQGDVESAATDLSAAEGLYNSERDIESVEMCRLLGMLAEGLALSSDAHAHYLAGQAKFGVLCDSYTSQIRLSHQKELRWLPKVQALLLRHQARLLVVSRTAQQALTDLALVSLDREDRAELSILEGETHLASIRQMCEKNPVYSLVAESSISLPPISHGGQPRKDVSSRKIHSLLSAADNKLSDALKSWKFLTSHALGSLCLKKVTLRNLERAINIGKREHAYEIAALLDYRSNLSQQRESAEAVGVKLRRGSIRPQRWLTPQEEHLCPDTLSPGLHNYWTGVSSRIDHRQPHQEIHFPDGTPSDWTAVTISLDKASHRLCVTRQRPGSSPPITLSLPMDRVGRREGEEQQFDSECALGEMADIVEHANSTSRRAKHVASEADKAAWWSERRSLDERLKVLLENIEHRWLGVFKVLLAGPPNWPQEALDDFISSLTRVLHGGLLRRRAKAGPLDFDSDVLGLFAQLSPTASHEDLEDLLHFIIESHQFAGASVVFDEIDLDQVATDVRVCLERLHECRTTESADTHHTFLILDKDAQRFPWESLPSLRHRSFSRIPSLAFLTDMANLLPHWSSSDDDHESKTLGAFTVNPESTYYMLNPGGDLSRTEASFAPWMKSRSTWKGICGRKPMTLELEQGLGNSEVFIYIGHGGAEDHIRSDTLRKLPRCALTFLWGCSSGTLRSRGQFDAEGTPWNYLMAGCPTLVANLWDVTDKDIDKITRVTFERSGFHSFALDLDEDHERAPPVSIAQAVAEARECCRMSYLNGAAPVVYGIPARVKV